MGRFVITQEVLDRINDKYDLFSNPIDLKVGDIIEWSDDGSLENNPVLTIGGNDE